MTTDPRPAAQEPAIRALGRHGIDCQKVLHIGEGYLHSHDYDGPYYVDGIMYCGRCHGWIETSAAKAESAPTAAVATGTERFNVPGVLRMLAAEAAAAFTGERTKIELVARLIRQQQGDIEEFGGEVQRLQRALSFWLPGVPADGSEVAQRAGDDAHLLAGYQSDEPDAEDLGWIRLRETP